MRTVGYKGYSLYQGDLIVNSTRSNEYKEGEKIFLGLEIYKLWKRERVPWESCGRRLYKFFFKYIGPMGVRRYRREIERNYGKKGSVR